MIMLPSSLPSLEVVTHVQSGLSTQGTSGQKCLHISMALCSHYFQRLKITRPNGQLRILWALLAIPMDSRILIYESWLIKGHVKPGRI